MANAELDTLTAAFDLLENPRIQICDSCEKAANWICDECHSCVYCCECDEPELMPGEDPKDQWQSEVGVR